MREKNFAQDKGVLEVSEGLLEGLSNRLENWIEVAIFAGRWFLAPLYV